jgi:hypothetical protein
VGSNGSSDVGSSDVGTPTEYITGDFTTQIWTHNRPSTVS